MPTVRTVVPKFWAFCKWICSGHVQSQSWVQTQLYSAKSTEDPQRGCRANGSGRCCSLGKHLSTFFFPQLQMMDIQSDCWFSCHCGCARQSNILCHNDLQYELARDSISTLTWSKFLWHSGGGCACVQAETCTPFEDFEDYVHQCWQPCLLYSLYWISEVQGSSCPYPPQVPQCMWHSSWHWCCGICWNPCQPRQC